MNRDIKKYQDCLVEIKLRIDVIKNHINGKSMEEYLIIEVEFVCLQFRKVLELIALSSLVANKNEYSEQHKKFATHYHAKLILQDLERINPKFYPAAAQKQQVGESMGRNFFNLMPIENGYLTKDEFVKIYETCGGILHAENPYGHKRDLKKLHEEFIVWINKIILLLNHHVMTLADGKTIIIGYMNDKRTGAPNVIEAIIVDGKIKPL